MGILQIKSWFARLRKEAAFKELQTTLYLLPFACFA